MGEAIPLLTPQQLEELDRDRAAKRHVIEMLKHVEERARKRREELERELSSAVTVNYS